MTETRNTNTSGDVARAPEWQQALTDLERCLRDATWAVTVLRRGLEIDAPLSPPADVAVAAKAQHDSSSEPAPEPAKGEAGQAAFNKLWDRIESERSNNGAEGSDGDTPERSGLDLLPERYLISVEDKDGKVDLVALHRAMLSLDGIEEMALQSYANGVPVVALRTENDFDPEKIGSAISTGMDRKCEVIPQGNGKIHVRMSARDE